MSTKQLGSSAKFDCYANARDDEEMFILLARDSCAPSVIRFWCAERIRVGKNKLSDVQIIEAMECAKRMEESPYSPIPF